MFICVILEIVANICWYIYNYQVGCIILTVCTVLSIIAIGISLKQAFDIFKSKQNNTVVYNAPMDTFV